MRSFVLCVIVLSFFLFGEELTVDSVVIQQDTANSVDTVVTRTEAADSGPFPVDSTASVDAMVNEVSEDVLQLDTTRTATAATTVIDTIDEKKVEVTETKDVASTSSVKKIKLRKRKFNYRQQVILAVGMMAFVAVIMTTAQTLNPK